MKPPKLLGDLDHAVQNPDPIHHLAASKAATLFPESPQLLLPQTPTFNYSLSCDRPVLLIPSLDDILNNTPESSNTPYNRSSFVKYLSLSHCLENLEFVVELNKLMQMTDAHQALMLWQCIYRTFIPEDSVKEINAPQHVKNTFVENELPAEHDLIKIKTIIYELLHDSYNEFIKFTKATNAHNAHNYRRKSEIIAPDFGDVPRLPQKPIPRLSIPELYEVQLSPVTSQEITSRNNSTTSSYSLRGSSLGLLVENLKNHDYVSWKKTVKKFKFRRFSNESDYALDAP